MWLTVSQVADLLNITERAVRQNIKKYCEEEKFIYRCVKGKGQGGMHYEILLESLPQKAQDKYNGVEHQEEEEIHPMMACNGKQRDLACYRFKIIKEYKDFKKEYPLRDKKEAFLERYNEEHTDKPITYRQLNHWEKRFDEKGWDGLIDRRGGALKGKSTIPDDVWNVFKKLWLQESQPSVQSCYDLTKEHFADRKIPAIDAFKRKIKLIPYIVKVRYREGKKACNDKCMPYIPQDYSHTYSNQLWIADHHIFDVLVVDENGRVFRPWLSAWQDYHSKMFVGYVLNKIEPNSDIVLDSFARACHSHGIPDGVKLDNGKDYKTYDLFNKDFPMSVCNMMNIDVTYALPYNAKAKPIERTFRTLEERYCKHLPSYIGNDPKKRPEKMKKVNTQLKDVAMPYNEFRKFVDDMLKTYNSTVHSALKGKSPIEAYKEDFISPMRIVADKDVLNMFLMRTSKPIKVGRNGVRVPAIGYYYDDTRLIPYQGQEVYVRYNSEDVRKVYIFTTDNDFICGAKCVELSEHKSAVTMEYIRELQRKKKARNKFIKEQLEDVSTPTMQEFVSRKAERFEDIDKDSGIIQLNPITYKQAADIKKEDEPQEETQVSQAEKQNKTMFNTREADELIAEFYKQAGGI